MLESLFLRRATADRIENILKKDKFIYTDEDVHNLLQGNQKGKRYGNAVLVREEEGEARKRFIKIVLDGSRRTLALFRRHVNVADALAHDARYNLPTMGVLTFSFAPPLPYAIFETREEGEGFGFMNDKREFYERLNEKDLHSLAKAIYAFHQAGSAVGKSVISHTRHISSDFTYYREGILKSLHTRVTHKRSDGSVVEKTIEQLIEEYTGGSRCKEKALDLLKKNWFVGENMNRDDIFLVHTDLAIDNVYKHSSGEFELLDFEWVGHTDDPYIALMWDYGNLWSRAWSSPKFQDLLGQAVVDANPYTNANPDVLKKVIMISKLRSGLKILRYHFDYLHTTKNDKRSEAEYQEMYPKSLARIRELLE
ncbi:MAG: hypothetical protein JWN89_608 [Parcubacteria group bacterium]|nr:hypothetical protein [Parcubacteria group bacterium]